MSHLKITVHTVSISYFAFLCIADRQYMLWGGNRTPTIIRRSLCLETYVVRSLSVCDIRLATKRLSDYDAVARGLHYKVSNKRPVSWRTGSAVPAQSREFYNDVPIYFRFLSTRSPPIIVTGCCQILCGLCFINSFPVPYPGRRPWPGVFDH